MSTDLLDWAIAHQAVKAVEANWRVGSTVVGPWWVSTVWLGTPYIADFETAILTRADVDILDRYRTWYDALLGHHYIVGALRAQRELP